MVCASEASAYQNRLSWSGAGEGLAQHAVLRKTVKKEASQSDQRT
jgi:hypothetical protein